MADLIGYTYIFLTNSDFKPIFPNPSILQSILWSSSTNRMFFTFVPAFMDDEPPFILRSLISATESPSFKIFPYASLTIFLSSALSLSTSPLHSWAHSGQIKIPSFLLIIIVKSILYKSKKIMILIVSWLKLIFHLVNQIL